VKVAPATRGGLAITELGFGGAAIGNLYAPVEHEAALATVHAAWAGGVRYFDTAPSYGNGLSERRIGEALAAYPRDRFVLSTKVGYSLEAVGPAGRGRSMFKDDAKLQARTDFSREAVERSLCESLERLASERIDLVWLHDPDEASSIRRDADRGAYSHFEQAMGEAYPVLDALRSRGAIGGIGVGLNQWQMLEDFARAGDFDCFLLAGRYTLLEQEPLASFLPLCLERGIGVVVGGPYNSGILASGATGDARYNYARAREPVLARVRALEQVCRRHGVALAAAALQLPLAHPAVISVIPGARSAQELVSNLRHLQAEIPATLWEELLERGLIDPRSPLPH
jgi:D-threo-aldose 1-dehydrogenase